MKKPIYKRWWFIALVIIIVIRIIGSGGDNEPEELTTQVANEILSSSQEPSKGEEPIQEQEIEETGDSQPDAENEGADITWDDLKGDIIGNSNKSFIEISKAKPSNVRKDKTGSWKKTVIAESIPIEEYALSYSDEYMEEGEIHFIINFNYNTTTVVKKYSGLIYVDIKEYQKKEEHDAKSIGNGMILTEYIIYPDGDIEEVEQ